MRPKRFIRTKDNRLLDFRDYNVSQAFYELCWYHKYSLEMLYQKQIAKTSFNIRECIKVGDIIKDTNNSYSFVTKQNIRHFSLNNVKEIYFKTKSGWRLVGKHYKDGWKVCQK